MSNTSLFNFKGHDVRTVEIGGQPWFVGADVCDCLGLRPAPSNGSYQNHHKRLAGVDLNLSTVQQPNGQRIRMALVSESGLYKLVLRSDKPEAKDSQNWVTRIVLPAIRKDGGYVQGEEHVPSGAMTEITLSSARVIGAASRLRTGNFAPQPVPRHQPWPSLALPDVP